MKCEIYFDEMYPVYYCNRTENVLYPWGQKVVEWPDDLNYDDYREVVALFHSWQERLEILYEKGERVCLETTSLSATPTSSTPTSSSL